MSNPHAGFLFESFFLNFLERTGGVAEALGIDAELVEHAHVEVGKRDLFAEIDVTAGTKGTAGISTYDDGEIAVTVTVAIGNATAVNDHGIVEEGLPIDILGRLHFLHEVSQLLDVKLVDLLNLIQVLLLPLVVGNIMMPFGNPDVFEGAIAAIVREEKGRDAGAIRLKREHHHVHKKTHVVFVISGLAGGSGDAGVDRSPEAFAFLNLALDLTNSGKVFLQLVLVIPTKVLVHRLGIVGDKIENGLLGGAALREALGPLFG